MGLESGGAQTKPKEEAQIPAQQKGLVARVIIYISLEIRVRQKYFFILKVNGGERIPHPDSIHGQKVEAS